MKQIRVGYFAGGDPLAVIQAIKKAEDAGFDEAWMGDHFTSWFPEKPFGETWSVLCAAAVSTSKIKLGTGVTDPFRRGPALLAQSAATLDRISRGRGILGIGCGEPMNLLPFGIQWKKPLSQLKETVFLIRELWKSSFQNPLTYSGSFTQFDGAYLQIRPARSSMPIYLGGSGPRLRALAGEVADGWFAYVHSPETYAEDVRELFEAASLSGRTEDQVDTTAFFHCAIGKDSDAAREVVSLPAAIALILSNDKLVKLGQHIEVPKELSLSNVVMKKEQLESLVKFAKQIPNEAIEKVAAFGTPDQIVARMEKYARAGAKSLVFSILGNDLERSFEIFSRDIIPRLREI